MRALGLAMCTSVMLCGPSQAQEPAVQLLPNWEYVADTVMGGVSRGQARLETVDGREAVRLTGNVSLDNNGGFVQIAFDLNDGATVDARGYTGITFDVIGNGARYDLRLRTTALTRPWQSFRTDFIAPPIWTTIRIPFYELNAHRTESDFNPKDVRRIGILAIGREMTADVAISSIEFYR
ncbi:MAG: CIA30 family protein [Tateyamaria sp.]|uniref:CIA30 family protein n=1 Tax=Tateyamaria sp. TaxID=1929288 RepID=UPI00329E99A9